MRKILVLLGISIGILQAQEVRLLHPPTPYRSLWKTSITTLAVANALDMHSSWGKRELNGALAGTSGRFGTQGALIKAGLQGGLIAVEYLITRHRPSGKLYRTLSLINFGAATAIGATAARNYTIPR